MRGVDMHVHLPTGRLGVRVRRALRGLDRALLRVRGPQPHSVEELVALYERLDLVGVLLGWDAQGQGARQRRDRADLRGVGRALRRASGSVDPNREDALERLARFPALGLRGLKLHPTMQAFDPGDDRFLPFFDAAAELGLILLTHAGTSGLGAGEPGGQGLRIDLARPILLDRIAARHPQHADRARARRLALAPRGRRHGAAQVQRLPRHLRLEVPLPARRGQREIPRRLRGQFCFGTDYPMFDPEACLAELDRLELPPDVATAVLRDNAAALLGL